MNPTIEKTTIESLDHEGRGISKQFEKVLFIENALPLEKVIFQLKKTKKNYDLGELINIIQESPYRVKPRCEYFGICGGCNLQHLEANTQVAIKQRILEDDFKHIGKTKPDQVLPPIIGGSWNYRHRGRLSVRYVEKKGTVLVGFHEKHSRFIANMDSCQILPKKVSDLIPALKIMFTNMSIREHIPQIEVAIGSFVTVFVLRILKPLAPEDENLLKAFADEHQVQWFLQPKGPDTVYAFYPTNSPALSYTLPEFNLEMLFAPTDFTQVNHALNQTMIQRAMRLLNPQPNEKIADLFCGLGNFTLPIARSGAKVIGIEGADTLVKKAQRNAEHNGLQHLTSFHVENLFTIMPDQFAQYGNFDKLLIDPPRDGAMQIVKNLEELRQVASYQLPKKIVYVSCNPSTLARDAGILVNTLGYKLLKSGIMNMFPHTAHVESIAEFEL